MLRVQEISVPALSIERFRALVDDDAFTSFAETAAVARDRLSGVTIWNVNSTAKGGGVAEMLQTLIAYARGVGIDARWLVTSGTPDFFTVTKRIHNGLHGEVGDGGPLGEPEHRLYEEVLAANAAEILALVKRGDVVLAHDPQTAGLVAPMQQAGATVIWRCHVGHDKTNDRVEQTWEWLRPYVEGADAYVFSRAAYAPQWCNSGRMHVIPPSIDPFSAKNQEMDEAMVHAVLAHSGLVADGTKVQPSFVRRDGSPGRVDRVADILRAGPPPQPDAPLVVQVSRWDRLKDMPGVMRGFAEVACDLPDGTELALVGPNVTGVADDPEGGQVLDECTALWRSLPHAIRRRIELVCLPMTDVEENAAIVNALQRHASVVVQKSLHEGFGLTVAEAMWKGRPIVASAVGGIQDQVVDGESGILLHDPTDLGALAASLRSVLGDPALAQRLGCSAKERARERFLANRHLSQLAELIIELLAARS